MVVRFCLPFLSTILLLTGTAAGQPSPGKVVTVKGITEVDRGTQGGQFRIAVLVTIAKGWHINAHTPSADYLIPAVLTFDHAPGLTYGDVLYPKGVERSFQFSDVPLRVYEGEIGLVTTVTVDTDLPPETYLLKGREEKVCVKPRQSL